MSMRTIRCGQEETSMKTELYDAFFFCSYVEEQIIHCNVYIQVCLVDSHCPLAVTGTMNTVSKSN